MATGLCPVLAIRVTLIIPGNIPFCVFLDTRGLGEVNYDAAEDLDALGNRSHALLVVCRLRDVEQSALHAALKTIRKSARHINSSAVLVIHTGADELDDEHIRKRLAQTQQDAIESAWGKPIDSCMTGFGESNDDGRLNNLGSDRLKALIASKVPELSLWLQKTAHQDAEHSNFEKLKTDILWYAGTVAVSDAIPVVGLVSVPAIQGKMLHSLAQKYSVEWSTRNFSEFSAALGTSFALRYATSLGARQLAKLVPGFGQLAGGALAVTVSYASTYALGRAACSYLYHKKTATSLNTGALQSVYRDAMKQGRKVGKEATRSAQK